MSEEALPLVRPEEAIALLKSKGWAIGFDWRDVWQQEHTRAFTVAKAMSRDLLEDIRQAVTDALENGTTLEQFIKDLRPTLASKGWWGRKWMTDPQTGEQRVVQLGSPARLRTIYQTNLRTSYMAGRWQRIQRAKATLPLLRYVSVMDGRERPQHHAWHGTILPVDDPWWDTHFPPCGWNCRCDAQPLNSRMLERKGWEINQPARFPEREYVNRRTGEVTRLEQGIDPGWSYNVGKASLDGLTPAPRTNGGEDEALQSQLSEGIYERLKGFFEPFGINDRDAAIAGRVVVDVAGWPLAVSAGLFRSSDGGFVPIGGGDFDPVTVAQILLEPDSIAWLWVTGEDGSVMLVRRYRSAGGVVDFGRSFWRWHIGGSASPATGRVAWSAPAN